MKIDWNKIDYKVPQAKRDFEKIVVKDTEVSPIDLKGEWKELRDALIVARDEVFDENNFDDADKLGYDFDITYGLKIYGILSSSNGFNEREASNDDIWNYLSVRVIPDVVHSRWGKKADRYYQNPRRTWLKTIWWYINLSWNVDEKTTYDIIKENSTDTILNLVERPGKGYNVKVCRSIMKKYKGIGDRNLFRKVLKLNTAKMLTISPELEEGGIDSYVDGLFRLASGGGE
ncbi:hypothetical protein [Ligilactobacillus ruminis]|uniref:hypothetical protein n=1 Tax=Ligilactobacillus ruminis TaxID=1623 RepID=UPI0034A22C45